MKTAISIVEADISVDFAPAVDAPPVNPVNNIPATNVEPVKPVTTAPVDVKPQKEITPTMSPAKSPAFTGTGYSLKGSPKVTTTSTYPTTTLQQSSAKQT